MIFIRPKPSKISKKTLPFLAFLLGFFVYGLHPPTVCAEEHLSATVENINPYKGTYDVVVTASSSSGIRNIQVPTWYDENGVQKTLYWYDAVKRSDGKYVARINYKNHNFHRQLLSHIYMFKPNDTTSAIAIDPVTIPNPKLSAEIQNLNQEKGTWDVVVKTNTPTKYIQNIQVPTWSAFKAPWGENAQDDIIWEKTTKQTDGSYIAHINVAAHNLDTGNYISHVYLKLQSGESVVIAAPTVHIPKTKKIIVNDSTMIDSEYKFIPHWIKGETTFETFGPAEWAEKPYDYGNTTKVHYTQPTDNMKGKIGVIYHNVGVYDGKTIDLKITVNDWKKAKSINGYIEYTEGQIAHIQQKYFYVDQIWQFLDANTGKPVKTTGYMTINDIDAQQGVAFDKQTSDAIQNYYVTNDTHVRFNLDNGNQSFFSHSKAGVEPSDKFGQVTFTYKDLDQLHFDWNLKNRPKDDYKLWTEVNLEDWYDGEYFSYTGVKIVKGDIPTPEKYIQNDGSDVLVKESKLKNITDTIHYVIYQTINEEAEKNYYPSLSIQDTLPEGVDYISAKITNSNKQNVTNRFKFSQNKQTIRFEADPQFLKSPKFYANDYRIDIYVKPKSLEQLTSTYSSKTITFKNTAQTIVEGYTPKLSNKVTTTYEKNEAPLEGKLIHYDYTMDPTGNNKNSWIQTEKIPFIERKTWISDWRDVEVTKIDESGNKHTVIEKQDFGHYEYRYDYKVSPKSNLVKKTDYGIFNYISYDDKIISDTNLTKDQMKNLIVKMPYIVPRVAIYPEKLIIDTDDILPEGKGLPFNLTNNKEEQIYKNKDKDFQNIKINIAIKDTNKNKILTSKIVAYNDINKEIRDTLKVEGYKYSEKIPVEVVLSTAENPDKREIIFDSGKFISFGFVASHDVLQGNIPKDKANEGVMNTVTVKKPIRTLKIREKDVKIYYETIHASITSKIKTKTGYGIKPEIEANYQNEIDNKKSNLTIALIGSKELISKKDQYGKIEDNNLIIPLINQKLPTVAIQKLTGNIRQLQTIDKTLDKNPDEIDGGNKLYIPIWHKLNTETLYLKGVDNNQKIQEIGINKMKLNMPMYIDIYAYMYNPSDSKSINSDEMLLKPNINE